MKQFLFLLTIAFLTSCSTVSEEPTVPVTDSLACDTTTCCVDTCAVDSAAFNPAEGNFVLEK